MLDRTNEAWPADYAAEFAERRKHLSWLRQDPKRWEVAKESYRTSPQSFIRRWGITYDPRNTDGDIPALLPFIPFKRQRELTKFVYACLDARQGGLIEKSRDMGATWDCVQISVHLWLFRDVSIGWGSRKAMLVDRIGDPDSIFEKIRTQLRNLPPELLPEGFRWDKHNNLMRIVNPENGSTITGEGGDDIGRGGRKSIYFVDEAAHLEHPESIEASLNSNTDVRIDISSVGGVGNVFHRRREAGVEWDPKVGIVKGRTNIFVMDWRHHPGKTQDWYNERRQKAEDEGLLHVHAQEVDRDYAASIQGTVIPAAWARAAIDAHVKLQLTGDGGWCGALDVADEGGDRNALALRRGIVCRELQEWGERDTGRTARRAVAACQPVCPIDLQYDVVGVGAGIKAETNRLKDEKLMPRGLRLVAWNGGAGPLFPKRRIIENDVEGRAPLNEEFYGNLKAQGWWMLRRRFEITYRAITWLEKGQKLTDEVHTPADYIKLAIRNERADDVDTFELNEDDLISLPSTLPNVWRLVAELSQPTISKNSRMKLIVDKKPEGTLSPNLADALMMAYWPANAGAVNITDDLLLRARDLPARKPSLAPRPKAAPLQLKSEVPVEPAPVVKEEPAQFPSAPSQPKIRHEIPLRSTRPPAAAVKIE